MAYILVTVYRSACGYDCSHGGMSSKHESLYLEHPEGDDKTAPRGTALKLVRTMVLGKEYVFAVPKNAKAGNYPMFGGNYISSSEKRFPEQYPIPVHDRIER